MAMQADSSLSETFYEIRELQRETFSQSNQTRLELDRLDVA